MKIGEYTIEDLGDGSFKITKPAFGDNKWVTIVDGGDFETFLAPIFAGSEIGLIKP